MVEAAVHPPTKPITDRTLTPTTTTPNPTHIPQERPKAWLMLLRRDDAEATPSSQSPTRTLCL